MEKYLIIIDYQYDFVNPNGSLYIHGAEKIIDYIKELVNRINYSRIIYTVDEHCPNHSSFGKWGKHCIINTIGASLPEELVDILYEHKGLKFSKGLTSDTYSCLDDIKNYIKVEDVIYDVVGVAGDVCVTYAVLDLWRQIKDSTINIHTKGIANIDESRAIYYKELLEGLNTIGTNKIAFI